MSEFRCRNGHEIVPSQGARCQICGGRVYSMDGRTNEEERRIGRLDEVDLIGEEWKDE